MPLLCALNGAKTDVAAGWLEAAAPTLPAAWITLTSEREAMGVHVRFNDGRTWHQTMRRAAVAPFLRSIPAFAGVTLITKHGMSGAKLAEETIGPAPFAFEAWI